MTPAPGVLHVAAAAIVDADGQRVLLARRPADKHQGGKWEFPGGKVEAGETTEAALARELDEELGICPTRARPLIRVTYHYPERSVLLDVWRVDAHTGEPHGREGQAIEWVPMASLREREFPPANLPIVRAVMLPDRYLITPSLADAGSPAALLDALAAAIDAGVSLLQLRAGAELDDGFIIACRDLARARGARLLLNGDPRTAELLELDGVHLNAARLRALAARPLPAERLVGVSCHSPDELAAAAAIDADFALLSPVAATPSHPEVEPLGWERFLTWTDAAALPVYALGGMGPADLRTAFAHGAQGIAAIRGLFPTR